ncbi:MAG: hypothetical protein IPN01_12755 [Deltaproteobacteria bacterium]|nr:hypothetical protein [Deltaproteobacteria bacterium]
MYTMREGASATMALTLLMFVYLRIVHRPAAADVAADLKTAHDDVEAKSSAAVSARRQRMLTTAEIRYLDEELDAAVSRYVKALMALLPEGRADARYLRMFPVTPTEMTTGQGSEEQSRMLKNVLAVHDSEAELAAISPFAEVLRAALAAIDAARAQRVLDYDAEQSANAALRASLVKARGVYNGAYPRLQVAFPGKKGLIRSFYYRPEKGDEADVTG